MRSDRPYMRDDYPRENTSVSTWLICAITGAFALQFTLDSRMFPGAAGLAHQFSLSVDNLAAGRIWTPFTFWLLHSTSNLFHVGIVLVGLFLVGRELLETIGIRRFLAIFSGSTLLGALFWVAVNGRDGGELIGATPALYGLVAVLALLQPNRQVGLLLFFLFPVSFRLKHLAFALLATDALALLLTDVLGQSLPFSYAPSAHLGGMLAGWICHRLFCVTEQQSRPVPPPGPHEFALAEAACPVEANSAAGSSVATRSTAELRAQVDRVLDKISSQGLSALTPGERRILEDAKTQLKRH